MGLLFAISWLLLGGTTPPNYPPVSTTYPDGAFVTIYRHCAVGDVCVRVQVSRDVEVVVTNGGYHMGALGPRSADLSVTTISGGSQIEGKSIVTLEFGGSNRDVYFDHGAVRVRFLLQEDGSYIDPSLVR